MAIDWNGLVLAPVLGIFAEDVTHQPASGDAWTATGVFTEGYQALSMLEDGTPITTEIPRLGIALADYPAAPVQGDTFTIRGAVYTVAEVRIDSHGRADLILNFLSG